LSRCLTSLLFLPTTASCNEVLTEEEEEEEEEEGEGDADADGDDDDEAEGEAEGGEDRDPAPREPRCMGPTDPATRNLCPA
jgi:hypothetical protein